MAERENKMKYDVKYSCGHVGTVELFGKNQERERKIDWYENTAVCSECYREQKEMEMRLKYDEVEMPFTEYKTNYPMNKTKRGSYDGEKKTIIVYIPKEK